MLFDTRTGLVFLSVLSLVVSVALWATLRRQRTLALDLWCLGGLAASAASLLLALRVVLPDALGYTVAVSFVLLMLVLKLQAIRLELGRPVAMRRLVVVLAALLAGYEALLLWGSEHLRYFAVFALVLMMNVWVAWWAMRLGKSRGHRSAYWIAGAFGLMAVMYGFRIVNAALGRFETHLLTQGYDALLLAVASLIGIIVSNIAWLGLALERLIQEQLAAATAQARGEESRRLSEQIARLERQRSLGLLSASLAHELNQPLTAVLTNAQVLRRALERGRIEPGQAACFLDRIVCSTRRVSQIVDHIRGFIRPTESRREPVDLARLTEEVCALVSAEARANQATLVIRFAEAPLWVIGDPIQLSQIVLNLLTNAIEAVSRAQRREIEVGLEAHEGGVLLHVKDSGSGLSSEALGRAGEPFFTTKDQGMGLGLSISRAIAQQHGGTLTLGNGVDGGAVAELGLPPRSTLPMGA